MRNRMLSLILAYGAGVLTIGIPAYLEHRRSMRALRDVLDVPHVPVVDSAVIPSPMGWQDHPPALTGKREIVVKRLEE